MRDQLVLFEHLDRGFGLGSEVVVDLVEHLRCLLLLFSVDDQAFCMLIQVNLHSFSILQSCVEVDLSAYFSHTWAALPL